MVITLPPDLRFSDSFYLLFGAAMLKDDIVIWQKVPFYLKPLVSLAYAFPVLGRKFMRDQLVKGLIGRPADVVKKADINEILEEDFLSIHREALAGRKFDCLFIGASNGGSLHLADIMHVPILGSGVNIFVSRESDPDDVKGFVEFGRSIADGFLSANKHVEVVIHLDPIHDRTNLAKVFHFRVKFWLPNAYRTFIREHLNEGGNLVLFDVQEPWLHYKLDERLYYQAGGLDDLTPEEFVFGSKRIDEWLADIGASHRGGWGIEGERPYKRFDDEFGNSPEMATEMKEFAQDEGFHLIHVKVKRSHDLSALCTYLIHKAMMDEKIRPKGVILEQYTQCVPLAVRRLTLLPVWTYFVSRTSFKDARRMLDTVFSEYLDEAEELVFLPTQPLNPSPLGDFVTFEEWEQLLHKYPVRKLDILTNRELYPLDTASLVTGPLAVFKRCQGKRDIDLDITLQDVIDASRRFL
mgnify:CR=1 FL=1